jgi:hypothetical protein
MVDVNYLTWCVRVVLGSYLCCDGLIAFVSRFLSEVEAASVNGIM